MKHSDASPADVAADLLATLEAAARPERAVAVAGEMPSALHFLGLPVPEYRAVLRPVLVAARAWPPADVHAVVRALRGAGVFEARQAAFELLAALPAARRALRPGEVVALAEGNDNWASVDVYACGVSGPAWREGQLTDAHVEAWAANPDRWLRRTALASTVPLNLRARGGTGDTPRTLAVCARLAADRDDMVVKALSWALRELAHWDPEAVRGFLAAQPVAARVRREVTTKLATGTKRGR